MRVLTHSHHDRFVLISMKNIIVVGAGISGLASAWLLARSGQYNVTLLEAGDYFGGHAHAVDVCLDGQTYPVDTGFLVFNHKTYPQLTQLLAALKIDTPDSDMSFGVSIQSEGNAHPLEWAGDDLGTVFAQRRNLLRPTFWRMLADILRFGHYAAAYRIESEREGLTLGQLLDRHHYSRSFQDHYLLPMGAAIWSSAVADIRDFPAASFLSFCMNHVLLTVNGRPQWKTIGGSSRQYVNAMLQHLPDARRQHRVLQIDRTCTPLRVCVQTPDAPDPVWMHTDAVLLACHSDQSLAILGDQATAEEQHCLAAIRYAPNQAVLHTDLRHMPQHRKVWSSWNYLSTPHQDRSQPVAVTYWLNRLQPLPFKTPLLLTLNPSTPIDPQHVLGRFDYAHPQMDAPALTAQQQIDQLQGVDRCYFAGAWGGYGFHEDGLTSAIAAVAHLGVQPPWMTPT